MFSNSNEKWSQYARVYDPLKIGSIDGTDTEPHDNGIIRAIHSEYRPNRHVKGQPECTIFVSRLNPKTTKETIKQIFSAYGKLRRFRMVKDIVTGMPKGYAFVEYESESAAEEAYRRANKLVVDDREIFVDFECERLLKGWKPRRLGGGFGGKKETGQLRFGGRDRPFKRPFYTTLEKHRTFDGSPKSRDKYYRDRSRRERSESRRSPQERHRSGSSSSDRKHHRTHRRS